LAILVVECTLGDRPLLGADRQPPIMLRQEVAATIRRQSHEDDARG
jgi:hypothetical protein